MKIKIVASGKNTNGSTFIEVDGDRLKLVYEMQLTTNEPARLRIRKFQECPTGSPTINEERTDVVRVCREFVLTEGAVTIEGGVWTEIEPYP